MALTVSDRIKETTTTTGTGTYTLGGAVTGFETFTTNLSNSDTTYYCCTDNTDFEVGLGTFTSSGTTLARTTILASSNSNNAVSWSSGTRTIFCTLPAAKAVFLDASGNATLGANLTVTGDLTVSGDDITMATNTAGRILVADGTNYNPVEVGGDVTIASNGAVTIAAGAVENSMLADDAVGADELAANAVVTASIVDDNVTQAKIADDAVGADQLASNAVVNASIASSAAIADSKLATISTAGKVDIGALEIDGASEMGAALADADLLIVDDGAGGTEKSMLASRIPTYVFSKVGGDATVASNGALTIAAQAVENSMLADDAVGADELAANAVVTASIVDDNVTQAKIADDAVGADQLAANAVVTASIVDDAVGADQLASSAVVTASIVDANVTLAKIANQAANTVLVRDANSSGVVSAKALATTEILIGDGTGFTAAALSGDVTMTNAGAVTIGAGVVENSMLADDAVGADELAANAVVEASIVDNAVTLAKMAGIARGKFIVGDSSGNPSVIGPGSNGQVLTSDGTDIAFADAAGASSLAADNLTAGDAAVLLTTSSGNITIDAAANNSDIILKGTDGSADTTYLTIDGSEAGEAIFNAGIVIADAGTIGSASDKDAIAIASDGVVTFTQAPVFPDGSIAGADINIDGTTDIGAALADADEFLVDDGGGGTNRRCDMSRVKTYVADVTLTTAAQTNITSVGTLTALTVDDITINGSTISDGADLTLDVEGDIILDANGADIKLSDNGTVFGELTNASSYLVIKNPIQDQDVQIKGNDGGAEITALSLDMSAAGAATFNNDVTAFSDRRLKTDIEPIDNALEKVMRMQGVYYKRNDTTNARKQVGVIAQEIEPVLPEVVLTADDEMQTKSVDYGKICAVLIESIKQLNNEVQHLKQQINNGG